MYRYGGRVIQARTSPWAYLLTGLGQGISDSISSFVEDRKKRKELTESIASKVLSGQIDPGIFATETAQDLMGSMGVSNQPQIKNLTAQALEKFQTPEKIMTSPSGAMVNIPAAQPSAIPLELYQQYQQEREAALRRQKFYQEELPEYGEKEALRLRLTNEINKQFEETPEEVIQHVYGVIEAAKKQGVPIENLTYKGVDVYTAVEKAKAATDQNVKALAGQGKYYNGITSAQDYRTNAIKILTGLKTGAMTTDQATGQLKNIDSRWEVIGKLLGLEGKAKMTPKDLEAIRREMNKSIIARNKENRLYAREGLIKPSEIEEIEPISEDILGEIEAPKLTSNPRGQLAVRARAEIGAAAKAEKEKGREPSPVEVEATAKMILGRNGIDPKTGQLLTMAEARRLARQYLLSKGHGTTGR
jgi:hypothetical protein